MTCSKIPLFSHITTASSFGCQPSTDTVATSADHIWRSGVFCRWSGPSTWSSLPKRQRDPSCSSAVFGRVLKPFLLSEYYSVSSGALATRRYINPRFTLHYITLHNCFSDIRRVGCTRRDNCWATLYSCSCMYT